MSRKKRRGNKNSRGIKTIGGKWKKGRGEEKMWGGVSKKKNLFTFNGKRVWGDEVNFFKLRKIRT